MADLPAEGNASLPQEPPSGSVNKAEHSLRGVSQQLLEKGMIVFYMIVGLSLMLMILVIMLIIFWGTITHLLDVLSSVALNDVGSRDTVREVFIDYISGILFILVILGLLSTIINYLKNGMTSM